MATDRETTVGHTSVENKHGEGEGEGEGGGEGG